MQFKSLLAAVVAVSSATAVLGRATPNRRSCSQADRFGDIQVMPTTVQPGDTITINADFTCGVNNFGMTPSFTDYYLGVPQNNNGHEPNLLLARRSFDPSNGLTDSFTAQIPHWFYVSGAEYQIIFQNTFTSNGTDGSPVLVQGGVLEPINLIVPASN